MKKKKILSIIGVALGLIILIGIFGTCYYTGVAVFTNSIILWVWIYLIRLPMTIKRYILLRIACMQKYFLITPMNMRKTFLIL